MAREQRAGRPVSWARRRKWCKQIIEAVAEIHSRGFVVGALGHVLDGAVAVDGGNNAILWRFRCFLRQVGTQEGFIPPEYRQAASEQRALPMRPDMDISHLVMWLWLVAGGCTLQTSNLFCRVIDYPLVAQDLPCYESYTDPVELPKLGLQIPGYFQEIVSCCRQADPKDRLPAWKLLEMFPKPGGLFLFDAPCRDFF